MNPSRAFVVMGLAASLACGFVPKKDDADAAAPTAVADAATTASNTVDAAAATPVAVAPKVVAKPAAPKDGGAGKASPTPTTDRFKRNIYTDGDCPNGFVGDDPYDGNMTCARSCKADADCHNGRKCQDAHTADGKVCTDAAPSADPVSRCKAPETEIGGACFHVCTSAKDCGKGESCAEQAINILGVGIQKVNACSAAAPPPKPAPTPTHK